MTTSQQTSDKLPLDAPAPQVYTYRVKAILHEEHTVRKFDLYGLLLDEYLSQNKTATQDEFDVIFEKLWARLMKEPQEKKCIVYEDQRQVIDRSYGSLYTTVLERFLKKMNV